ncbi:YcjF family protein [Lacticaseibacillus hegangensis]|uniref:YcjF family protein n=1 Tax=Lacticaseibacillus hegangensis TaxID=2486010 RepID=A0ABW4CYF0_9LACO|nr:DUF697 domain-containing protein [Lacticaseibacillus hegangensis]
MTEKIRLIEAQDFPVRIYDTVGFEMNALAQWRSVSSIKKLIKSKQKTTTIEDDIHCLWYCVNASGSRIEGQELKYINQFVDLNIPVILVLTKAYSPKDADELGFRAVEKIPALKTVNVLAEGTTTQPAYGVQELVELTAELLPDSLQQSFASAQKASLELKHKKASAVVNATVATTFGTGFVPIPVADAPIMMAAQSTMLSKITAIYGVDPKSNQIETAIAGALGVLAAVSAGKTAVTSVFKAYVGIGTLVGGLISGSVGGALTAALGHAYMQLMALVVTGKVDLSSLSSSELTDMLTSLIKNATDQKIKP